MTDATRRAIGFTYGAILLTLLIAFGYNPPTLLLVLLNGVVLLTMFCVGRRDRRRSGEGTAQHPPEDGP